MPRTEAERFWAKVDKSGRCWLWTASKNSKGYGYFGLTRVDGKNKIVKAHRWSWEQWYGPIPEDKVLDHVVCDNPSCVKPTHMALRTSGQNTLRSTKAAAAINSRKTHCPKGHPYDQVYMVRGRPKRYCGRCGRERVKEWKRGLSRT